MNRMLQTYLGFVFIVFILMQMGCAGSRKDDPSVVLRSQRVQACMVGIASALDRYHGENGFFPQGLATLREMNYVMIMPDLEREWEFRYALEGDTVVLVEATSTETMLDGAGYKISYRVPDNHWEGYGITVWPR